MQQNKKGQMSTVTIILIVLIVAMSVAAIAGMVAYNSIQAKNQAKTKTASKSVSASKKNKSSNQSTNSRKSSSAASSNNSRSTSSRQSTPELNVRQVGTLLSLLHWPNYFKERIDDPGIYYGDDQLEGQTYHVFSGNGDSTSILYYQIDGDTITYRFVDPSNSDCVADAPIVTKTISLKRLVNDYYNTSAKRAEVNGYVAKLKPLSEIQSNEQADDDASSEAYSE